MYRFIYAVVIISLLVSRAQASAIHNAVRDGNLEKVRALVEQDASLVEAPDESGKRPVHLASGWGRLAVLRFLIAKKADVNAREGQADTSPTALAIACAQDHEDCALLLIDAGADVNLVARLPNTGDRTPLLSAAEHRNTTLVKILVTKKADVGVKDGQGRTAPLLAFAVPPGGDDKARKAAELALKSTLSALAEAKADLTVVDSGKQSLLHIAVARNLKIVTKYLITQKLDVNARDAKDRTPLKLAIDGGDIEMITILKNAGGKTE